MTRPRLLDLFCCEGGDADGYARAGFDVVGVDIVDQPHYPFRFVQDDALAALADFASPGSYPWDGALGYFDAIHASPPCQGYTTMSNRHGSDSPQLIGVVRDLLEATGLPYVIENVCGARPYMKNPMMLHGGMFPELGVWRPRLFESNVLLFSPPPARRPPDSVAVYGQREDHRRLWTRADGSELRAATLEQAREAMGMPWATWNGVREAIPPAYTEHIGRQLLAHLGVAA